MPPEVFQSLIPTDGGAPGGGVGITTPNPPRGVIPAGNSPATSILPGGNWDGAWGDISTNGKESLASNRNYLVALRAKGGVSGEASRPISVIGNCPENFGISLQNEWESMISSFLGQSSFSGGAILKGTGMALLPQFMTAQVWKGTSPLEFRIPFKFNAHSSALAEVVVPIRNLIRLASPFRIGLGNILTNLNNATQALIRSGIDEAIGQLNGGDAFKAQAGGSILHAPGPTFWEYANNITTHNIEFILGRAIYLESVVITSLEVEWDSQYTAEGYPVAAVATVGIKSHYTLDRTDLLARIFPGQGLDV